MGAKRGLPLLAALAAVLVCSGCVERELIITSDPPGATVTINQTTTGTTPFTYRFKHWGVYDMMLEMDDYYPLRVAEPIKAPLYEHTGPDLAAAMAPVRIKFRKELHYILEKREHEDKKEEVFSRYDERRQQVDAQNQAQAERDKKLNPDAKIPLMPTKEEQRKEKREVRKEREARDKAEGETETDAETPEDKEQPAAADSAAGVEPKAAPGDANK